MALDTRRVAGRIRGADYQALRSQIIRASMSVPANIVEGSRQDSSRQFSRFLKIALNSSTELEYHLITARDLQIIRRADALTLISQVIEVRKMLYGLLRYLASRNTNPREGKTPFQTQSQ